jgi:peptidoglycan/LPS O-acetylase OafA/YrhL
MLRQQLNDEKRVFGLDLMRAVAILMVLLAHCGWIFPKGIGIFSQVLALFGFLGVEIFFVLSGFLIGRILYAIFVREPFTFSSVKWFLRRRWFRTFPNYFLVLLINIAIGLYIGYEIEGLWKYFFFLQNFASPLLPFFPESWSLSVEEFAYLLLPMALLFVGALVSRSRRNAFAVITILLILVFIVAKIAYHINTADTSLTHWNIALKSVVIYRLDSIFIGVLASWIYVNYRDSWKMTKRAWAALGVILIAFFTAGVGFFGLLIDRYPFFWNVIYLPMASFAVACFLPFLSEWKAEPSPWRKPITLISLISYSIYLLHYSVVLQMLKHFVDTESLTPLMTMIFTASYLSLTICLSILLYRFFEKPMTDRREVKSS